MAEISLQSALEALDNDATVFAYIDTPAATTTTLAGTYYKVAGAWTNEILNKFSIDGVTFNLQYDGVKTKCFDISVNASISSNTVNSVVTMGLRKNGVLETNSLMSVKLAQTTDIQAISFNDVLDLETGDEVEIVMMSDQAGAEVTAQTLTTKALAIIKE